VSYGVFPSDVVGCGLRFGSVVITTSRRFMVNLDSFVFLSHHPLLVGWLYYAIMVSRTVHSVFVVALMNVEETTLLHDFHDFGSPCLLHANFFSALLGLDFLWSGDLDAYPIFAI
jgi:hypothetical protein